MTHLTPYGYTAEDFVQRLQQPGTEHVKVGILWVVASDVINRHATGIAGLESACLEVIRLCRKAREATAPIYQHYEGEDGA